MLAMALLLHGGLLGGMGGEAAGVDGSGEGAWTLATPAEGFLAASGTGELAHLLTHRAYGTQGMRRRMPCVSSICACFVPSHVARACARSGAKLTEWP